MANRILWNWRDNGVDVGCVDEVVLHDVDTVHVEQVTDAHWWIGIDKTDGTRWSGDFYIDASGRLRFVEQESTIKWESDASHEDSKLRDAAVNSRGRIVFNGDKEPSTAGEPDAYRVTVEVSGPALDDAQLDVMSDHGFFGELDSPMRFTRFFERRNPDDTIDGFASEAVALAGQALRDGQQIVAVHSTHTREAMPFKLFSM
jgi:hypothetical protein